MNLQNHGFGLHKNLRQQTIRMMMMKMNQKIRRLQKKTQLKTMIKMKKILQKR
jgi:hypothetical protein